MRVCILGLNELVVNVGLKVHMHSILWDIHVHVHATLFCLSVSVSLSLSHTCTHTNTILHSSLVLFPLSFFNTQSLSPIDTCLNKEHVD